MRLWKRRGWTRWLGLIAIPLVILSSFLGLLIGIAGLCVGAGNMDGHAPTLTLCLFFCGAIAPTAILVSALWIVVATLPHWVTSAPAPPLGSIFRPPIALAA